jgi:hypothetical protein
LLPPTIEAGNIAVQHVPVWPVGAQRGAARIIDLHQGFVLKSSTLQAQGLAACSRADRNASFPFARDGFVINSLVATDRR